MKNNWIAAALGIAILGLSTAAQATIINRTFDIVASRFTQSFGSDPTAPTDPVFLNFTLVFDNSADIGTTTSGLTINSFNLPYSAEFQYFTGSDGIALATSLLGPATCSSAPGKFCAFIHDATSAAPTLIFFQNSLPTNNVWQAETRFLTYTDAPSVPEPAIWALMLIGFGGLGTRLRRLRAKPTMTA